MGKVPSLCLGFLMAIGSLQAAKTLEIYFVDTEGGQTTLIVSPSGQSLLIDTGWAANAGRDAMRIAAAAKSAGVKKIDFLMITHFHADHVGGVKNLAEKMPIGMFLDHGPSVETNSYPKEYEEAFSKAQHKVLAPGDTIPLKDVNISVLAAAGKNVERKGEPNSFCAGVEPKPASTRQSEDAQSISLLIEWKKFRFADLGDLTWNRELSLVCPENLVGKVDLYLTTNHGSVTPEAVWGIQPRVIVLDNGPRKGGPVDGWTRIKKTPGLEDFWQMHFSMEGGSQANVSDTMIANVDEKCEGVPLKVVAAEDGSFTVTNPRNKYTKTYKSR